MLPSGIAMTKCRRFAPRSQLLVGLAYVTRTQEMTRQAVRPDA
jgi:hypothetical protein